MITDFKVGDSIEWNAAYLAGSWGSTWCPGKVTKVEHDDDYTCITIHTYHGLVYRLWEPYIRVALRLPCNCGLDKYAVHPSHDRACPIYTQWRTRYANYLGRLGL